VLASRTLPNDSLTLSCKVGQPIVPHSKDLGQSGMSTKVTTTLSYNRYKNCLVTRSSLLFIVSRRE